jgi:hypothetical protein
MRSMSEVRARQVGAALQTSRGPPPIINAESALDAYAAQIAALGREGLTRGLPGDATERFFAVGFGLEQMRRNFKDHERCVAEWSGSVRPPAGWTCALSASGRMLHRSLEPFYHSAWKLIEFAPSFTPTSGSRQTCSRKIEFSFLNGNLIAPASPLPT